MDLGLELNQPWPPVWVWPAVVIWLPEALRAIKPGQPQSLPLTSYSLPLVECSAMMDGARWGAIWEIAVAGCSKT